MENHSNTDQDTEKKTAMEDEHMDHSQQGHSMMDHSMHMGNLKQKFFISLVAAIPIILLSPMMGLNLPFQFEFPGSDWLVLILATFLFFYGGMPFLKGAKMELSMKEPAMMTLIALGITASYGYSLYAFAVNHWGNTAHVMDFFWELATLIVIMLLGHWIEMNAVENAGNALEEMAKLLPNTAHLFEDGKTRDVALADVQVGQQLLIKAGEKIPTDGKILTGSTSVNEAMVTGEAREVTKEKDEQVIGGSVNGSGSITIEVTGTGESGYLAQVMSLVEKAQKEQSNVELMSDKVAKWLFYIALSVGILAFVIWLFVTDLNTAFERMVTVLVIACPHALGLAISLVVARSTSIAAKNGLLLQNRQALETAKKVDTILMDKTGTLTEGNFTVRDYRSFDKEYTDKDVLTYIAALEQNSNHPLAIGILNKAKELKLDLPSAEQVENLAGVGLSGKVAEKEVKVTSVAYLKKQEITYDTDLFDELSQAGSSVSFLLVDEKNIGLIAQGDQIKKQAYDMIASLKDQQIQTVMLTGDNQQVAQAVARELGIDTVYAELMPEDKEKIIQKYKDQDQVTLMVGDGINDAPSLARADIGMAIGAGTDVAIDSADVILVKSDPSDILHFLNLAKKTNRKMIQNMWWGAGYNILAIPLAAGILAPIGFTLSPAVGAILMSLSTIIVAINAMLLKIDQ